MSKLFFIKQIKQKQKTNLYFSEFLWTTFLKFACCLFLTSSAPFISKLVCSFVSCQLMWPSWAHPPFLMLDHAHGHMSISLPTFLKLACCTFLTSSAPFISKLVCSFVSCQLMWPSWAHPPFLMLDRAHGHMSISLLPCMGLMFYLKYKSISRKQKVIIKGFIGGWMGFNLRREISRLRCIRKQI